MALTSTAVAVAKASREGGAFICYPTAEAAAVQDCSLHCFVTCVVMRRVVDVRKS